MVKSTLPSSQYPSVEHVPYDTFRAENKLKQATIDVAVGEVAAGPLDAGKCPDKCNGRMMATATRKAAPPELDAFKVRLYAIYAQCNAGCGFEDNEDRKW